MYDLDELVGTFIDSQDGWPVLTRSAARGEWTTGSLHATDLTKCPRQVAMRLRGDVPEPHPPQKIRQFWAANQQHELIYAAIRYHDKTHPDRPILLTSEMPVRMPDGWTGTADMVLFEYHNQHDHTATLHVGDSKNPHPNTVHYYAGFPKEDDVFQVSTYTAFLSEEVPEVEGAEGEVFYMPLGGAGVYKPTRFRTVRKELVVARMGVYEDARDNLPHLPDRLPLEVRWPVKGEPFSNKRMNKNLSGGDIVLGKPWQCGYCRFQCSNRDTHSVHLAKVSTAGGGQTITLTSKGRKYEDDIARFLEEDAKP